MYVRDVRDVSRNPVDDAFGANQVARPKAGVMRRQKAERNMRSLLLHGRCAAARGRLNGIIILPAHLPQPILEALAIREWQVQPIEEGWAARRRKRNAL